MHLNRFTDLAYRVLLYTAVNSKRCTLKEISDHYDISLDHLRKVVHALGKLNYLRTYKGKAGGMELNISPNKINLAGIYCELEMVRESVIDCSSLGCILNSQCKLKSILRDSEQAFIAELGKYNLEDLIESNSTRVLLA